MTDQIREHECPNCGAPLGIPHEHDRFFKCQFCGTVLEDRASQEEKETGVFNIKISQEEIDAAQQERLQTYSAPPVITTYSTGGTTASVNRGGCILTIVIFLFVGGILAVALIPPLVATGAMVAVFETLGIESDQVPFIEDSGTGGLDFFSFGTVAMLPSDNDSQPDFVGVARAANDSNQLLYIDLEADPAVRWMVAVTEDGAESVLNRVIADDTHVYLSVENKILAFNRSQGTFLWQAELSDDIQHNICEGCFRVMGDKLLTLSVDGSLEAWDAATGDRAWSVRLNETPRQIVNFGGNPGVLDEVDDTVSFFVFNTTDGLLVEQFTPACPSDPFPDYPQTMTIYDVILEQAGGDGAYFFAGSFEPACATYWQPGQTEPTWMATYPAEIGRNIDEMNFTLTEDTLLIAVDTGAYEIDLANGTFRTLLEDEDYNFLAVGANDGVFVVQAERTRGTRRSEIWGIDTSLGNVKWTFVPEAEEFFDYLSHPLDTDGAWVAGMTHGGVTVAQMYDEPPRVVFQTIPLQSGTAAEPVTFSFRNDIGGHWVSVLGWRGNTFWVVEGTEFFAVDVTNGQIEGRWP